MNDAASSLFKTLISRANDPYPYQLRVADRLAAGGSVLLSAPTGAGKTWAALLGYLAGLREDRPHADRILYALPLRTLATGLFQSTRTACARVKDWGEGRPPAVSIQTGEENDFFPNRSGGKRYQGLCPFSGRYRSLAQEWPEAARDRGKCVCCEWRNYCNDIF